MQTILLLILDLILAAIAYFLYLGVFVPILEKNKTYDRLKAKEKAELDRQIDVERYFGCKSVDIAPTAIKIKVK
jgi:hypothetical protein